MPNTIREVYSFLHVAYAISQADTAPTLKTSREEFYAGIKVFKQALSRGTLVPGSLNDRNLFDDLARVMAEEFECAIRWIKRNRLAYLGVTLSYFVSVTCSVQQELPASSAIAIDPRREGSETRLWDSEFTDPWSSDAGFLEQGDLSRLGSHGNRWTEFDTEPYPQPPSASFEADIAREQMPHSYSPHPSPAIAGQSPPKRTRKKDGQYFCGVDGCGMNKYNTAASKIGCYRLSVPMNHALLLEADSEDKRT
ncbi:hypothetical protein ABW19_dt0202877 [Dactylella cylindrospora]|nr:hypothetical protein ABW19_dt0202877 [Dactylella cylindrospora]